MISGGDDQWVFFYFCLVNIFTRIQSGNPSYAIIFSGDRMNYTYFDNEKKYIQRIRGLREDHDYSQKYVADYLCTSQTMYARYERDASAMPIRHLIYLARLYNVSTDYILGLTDMPSSYNELLSAETAISRENGSGGRYSIRWKTSNKDSHKGSDKPSNKSQDKKSAKNPDKTSR